MPNNMKRAAASAAALIALALLVPLSGCVYVKTHSTIEPIHMTLDVNLKVQLQKELADAFGDIDAASTTVNPSASTP
jgi:hypothetical protein